MKNKIAGKPKVHLVLEFTKDGHGKEKLKILKVFSDANELTANSMGFGLDDLSKLKGTHGKKSYAVITKTVH